MYFDWKVFNVLDWASAARLRMTSHGIKVGTVNLIRAF